jgi:hypothetical protein
MSEKGRGIPFSDQRDNRRLKSVLSLKVEGPDGALLNCHMSDRQRRTAQHGL